MCGLGRLKTSLGNNLRQEVARSHYPAIVITIRILHIYTADQRSDNRGQCVLVGVSTALPSDTVDSQVSVN